MAIFRIPVNLAWNGGGSPGVNVFHARDDAWPGSTNLDGALTALSAAYAALASTTSGIYPAGLKITLGDIVEMETSEYVQPGSGAWTDVTVAGTAGYAPAPVQLVVSWRTTLAARRGMGRTFLGPLKSTVLDTDGTPTATAVTAAQAFGQALLNHNGTTGAANFGIYGADQPLTDGQKASGDYPRVLRDITGFRVRDRYAVLRSRRD